MFGAILTTLSSLLGAPPILIQPILPTISYTKSFFVAPRAGTIVTSTRPTIIGLLKDSNGKPIANEGVIVQLDAARVGYVTSDANGVFTYVIRPNFPLTVGMHVLSGSSVASLTPIKPTSFFVTQGVNNLPEIRSGNVNVANSQIAYPGNGDYTNSSTPCVVGLLRNSSNNPVTNETVQVQINSSTVGTVTSNAYGIFSYTLTSGQALADGIYTVGAYCEQTNVNLTTTTFTVDTTPPAAPNVTTPTNGSSQMTSTVPVIGTTGAGFTVTVYMDGDSYGEITDADGSGNWEIDFSLANGSHSFTAMATDLADNNSSLTSTITFTVNA